MVELMVKFPSGPVALNQIPDRSVGYADYRSLALNTAERAAILPKLTDEGLAELVEREILPNIRTRPNPVTYEESLAALYAPELARRLRGHAK